MKKMKLFALLATLLLLVAVVFTGCGGGDDDGGTTAPGTTAPGTTNPGTTDPGTTDPGTTVPTPTEYTITFSVNGTNTEVVVAAGELPAFTGSTDKAPDTAKRIAYEFAGWDKQIVAATENTTYTAKYNESLIFVSETVNEDFSATAFAGDLGIGGQIDNFNRINLAGKANVSWKTVGDTDKYLLLTLKPGSGDPVINIVQDQKGGLAAQMGGYKKVTFSFDLKKEAGLATPAAEFRVRAGGDKPQILTITTEGVVNLIGNKGADVKPLTTLSETAFKTVAITIDFATGTIEGYVDGAKIADSTFVSPKADETPAEFLARANVYLLDSWITPNAAAATADQALCIDNLKVTVEVEHEITFVVNSISHKQMVKDGELPVFAGSTDKAPDKPNRIGYEFTGWDKELAPATGAATYTAQYTEYQLPYDPVIADEDFSELVLDLNGSGMKNGMFNFSPKSGTSMKTVEDGAGNKYMLFTQILGAGDPLINLSGNGGLKKLMDKYTSVTFSLDLAKKADFDVARSEFCLRNSGSEKIKFLLTETDGSVVLYDTPLTTLTETFKTISVTVDFKTGTLTGSVDGTVIATTTFKHPNGTDTAETYLSQITSYTFNWWFYGNKISADTPNATDRVLLVDNIKVIVDAEYEINFSVNGVDNKQTVKYGETPVFTGSTDKAPDKVNKIAYEFIGWDKEIVPVTGEATYTAQYREVPLPYDPVIADEDFSETTLNLNAVTEKLTHKDVTISYSAGKTGVTMKTLGDTNKYLEVGQTVGAKDPQINMSASGVGLAGLMGEYKKVTFSFDLAKKAGYDVTVSELGVRGGSNNKIKFINTAVDGTVTMQVQGSDTPVVLTTLSETFKTIAVTMDFENGTIVVKVDGVEMATASFKHTDGEKTAAEYLAEMKTYVFSWWFAGNKAPTEGEGKERALLIDNIKIVVDVPAPTPAE